VSHTRVKICGITNEQDALAVVASGADALGLVFYAQSPRAVTLQRAQRIAASVPPFVTLVGLFVDETPEFIDRVLQQVPLDMIQFHGDESPAFCSAFQRPWIKAVRMRPEVDLQAACSKFSGARGMLVDSWQEGVPGGTGKTFDWRLLGTEHALPVVLAGGLNCDNVAAAIAEVRPAAVDVSGGVEKAPGEKDQDLIKNFVAQVRLADESIYGSAQ